MSMENVKGNFDEGTMVVMFETKRKRNQVRFYSLLYLAIQFTDRRMHTKESTSNKQRGCGRTSGNVVKEKAGDMGYRESYLGVKHPSLRPLSSVSLMESWYLQRSKDQEKSIENKQ